MSARPIVDAGPALNFLAINQERILTSVVGRISTPEAVENEVLEKSRTDPRFRAVAQVWARMRPNWIELLNDDETPDLSVAVHRMTNLPIAERKSKAKDLGEVMVVAHAVVKAESGEHVIVIIDDQAGALIATAEKRRLERLRRHRPVGSITIVGTIAILRKAAGGKHLPEKNAMREVYTKLRGCDDGLPPIQMTPLLSPSVWS